MKKIVVAVAVANGNIFDRSLQPSNSSSEQRLWSLFYIALYPENDTYMNLMTHHGPPFFQNLFAYL